MDVDKSLAIPVAPEWIPVDSRGFAMDLPQIPVDSNGLYILLGIPMDSILVTVVLLERPLESLLSTEMGVPEGQLGVTCDKVMYSPLEFLSDVHLNRIWRSWHI